MYNNNSIFISGSLTSSFAPPRLAYLKSQIINNSTAGTYTIFSGSDDFGNFIPTKTTFHYNTADGTAATAPRFHLGYAGNLNAYISSGSLTQNGSTGVKTNIIENFTTFITNSALPNNTDLIISLFTIGTSKITGSFIIHGFFEDL